MQLDAYSSMCVSLCMCACVCVLCTQLDALNLLAKLSITILVPSVTGKLVREFITPARNFATKRKVGLGMIATALLAFIIWQVGAKTPRAMSLYCNR